MSFAPSGATTVRPQLDVSDSIPQVAFAYTMTLPKDRREQAPAMANWQVLTVLSGRLHVAHYELGQCPELGPGGIWLAAPNQAYTITGLHDKGTTILGIQYPGSKFASTASRLTRVSTVRDVQTQALSPTAGSFATVPLFDARDTSGLRLTQIALSPTLGVFHPLVAPRLFQVISGSITHHSDTGSRLVEAGDHLVIMDDESEEISPSGKSTPHLLSFMFF